MLLADCDGPDCNEKPDSTRSVRLEVCFTGSFVQYHTTSMENTSRKRTVHVGLWSALAGGALGFTLGMMFAPQRGPDTRRRLAYQLEHLAAQTEDLLRRFLESAPKGGADQSGEELVADAQARADHIRDDIDALLEELRKQSAASAKNGDTD
ncbi:hypothetical protein BSZ35_07665 [Salinibacter sp. 10B]|nr:hypothetical protein BSZ35_07665 [Salinibacter sp. 10B]